MADPPDEGATVAPCFTDYLQSGSHSDIEVCYSGHTKKLHKVVLCSHSGWFRHAFEGGFMEAQAQSIELHGDDPDVLTHMIDFIYRGNPIFKVPQAALCQELQVRGYDIVERFDAASSISERDAIKDTSHELLAQYSDIARADVLFILKAYELANKYDVETYSLASAEAFKRLCQNKTFGRAGLKKDMGLYKALYYDISRDHHELRKTFIRAVIWWSSMPSEQLRNFTKECPEFASDFLSVMWSVMTNGSFEAKCLQCGENSTFHSRRHNGGISMVDPHPNTRRVGCDRCASGFEIRERALPF